MEPLTKSEFQRDYYLSILLQYLEYTLPLDVIHPKIVHACREAYDQLSEIVPLPQDIIIFNYGQFISLNHSWEKKGIHGIRTAKIEQALIEDFSKPGPPVRFKKQNKVEDIDDSRSFDGLQQYHMNVFEAIADLSQFQAMQFLCTGGLREYVRARSIDRYKDYLSKQWCKKRSANISPLVYTKKMRGGPIRTWGEYSGLGQVGIDDQIGQHEICSVGLDAEINLTRVSSDTRLSVKSAAKDFTGLQQEITSIKLRDPGLTAAEIGKIINMSEQMVRKHFERIRKQNEKKRTRGVTKP